MDDELEQRVDALERAVTDGDHDLSGLTDAAEMGDRVENLEERIETIEERTEELEAATQALRGYVGNIRSVNRDVEQRADAALAKAETIESALAPPQESSAEQTASERSVTDQTANERTAPDHRPSETHGHTAETSATPDGGLNGTDTSPGNKTQPAGRGQQALNHSKVSHNHCQACGQRTENDTQSGKQDATQPVNQTETHPANQPIAPSDAQNSTQPTDKRLTTERGVPEQAGAGWNGETLDGSADHESTAGDDEWGESLFPADEEENADSGTLQRIRDML